MTAWHHRIPDPAGILAAVTVSPGGAEVVFDFRRGWVKRVPKYVPNSAILTRPNLT
jgi:hypothetical protein